MGRNNFEQLLPIHILLLLVSCEYTLATENVLYAIHYGKKGLESYKCVNNVYLYFDIIPINTRMKFRHLTRCLMV